MPDVDKFLRELEEAGEKAVRRNMTDVIYGDGPSNWRWRHATAFLERKMRQREAGHLTKAEIQSDELVGEAKEANRLAKDANRISKEANRVAVAAFILSAIALAISLGLFF